MEKKFPNGKIKKEFEYLNINEFPKRINKSFDVIFDGRKEGKLAYKGLIPQYCIYYTQI